MPKHLHNLKNGHHVVRYFSTCTGRVFTLHFSDKGGKIDIKESYIVSINGSNTHLVAGPASLGLIQTLTFMTPFHVDRGKLVLVLADWRPNPHPPSM